MPQRPEPTAPTARHSLVMLAMLASTLVPPAAWAAPQASGVKQPSQATESSDAAGHGIAWVQASSDADVDTAFSRARAERKPLFLYWGAKWCPPCNQVKATLFNRQDFIARSRAFVPVYIDGDSPGAQKLGSRFKVRGYPTMVLFKADGSELTRLPGEVDARQYTEVLTLGINARRPVKEVLADARQGGRKLSAADWRMLAFYSWDTDEQQAVPKAEVPAMLKQLAASVPPAQADTAARLMLQALTTAAEGSAAGDAKLRARVERLLADRSQSRAQMDILSNRAVELVKALTTAPGAERQQLQARLDTRLLQLSQDQALSRADRIGAQIARVELARLNLPAGSKDVGSALPQALVKAVREQVARDDREISNGYERMAVVTAGAHALTRTGLVDDSDSLLKANLAKSHSPYYLMSSLASNAKARGDHPEALRWYEQAYARSEGPATRLQWGSSYINALIDLSPQDTARIERAVQAVFKDAAGQPNAFYERSARSMQRIGSKLTAWVAAAGAGNPAPAASLQRLQEQLDGICTQLPAGDGQRAVCQAVLKPPADGKAA